MQSTRWLSAVLAFVTSRPTASDVPRRVEGASRRRLEAPRDQAQAAAAALAAGNGSSNGGGCGCITAGGSPGWRTTCGIVLGFAWLGVVRSRRRLRRRSATSNSRARDR